MVQINYYYFYYIKACYCNTFERIATPLKSSAFCQRGDKLQFFRPTTLDGHPIPLSRHPILSVQPFDHVFEILRKSLSRMVFCLVVTFFVSLTDITVMFRIFEEGIYIHGKIRMGCVHSGVSVSYEVTTISVRGQKQ